MQEKILFIDDAHPILIEELTLAGFQCDYFPTYTLADYEKIISEYIGIIIRSKILMNQQIIDKAVNLKFIGRVGAGMESIDVEYAESKGIVCINSPEGNRDAVGEHALGMLLCLFNRLKFADLEMRKGIRNRESNRGLEIKGKTIGIIGYGNMGSAFAQRLKGFEAHVIAYDKYKTGFSNEYVTETSLQDIFANSDILSLHVPLTEETDYMLDEAFIKRFHKDFYLINTSRGQVVKTDALVEALKSGKIKGCCLDVIEYEKFSFEEIKAEAFPKAYQFLTKADNVLLSPHVAGWTVESKYKLAKILADKIIKTNFIKNK
ncbi:MAG: hydroxyacid dehydrogenase [Bacteroidetes bacterium]|nr:hydroxyacid dehydrogenase [Bacteroidota bacterium]